MAWRLPQKTWEARKGAANRRALKRLVGADRASGVLAFVRQETAGTRGRGTAARRVAREGEPVGWCSVGPRADFAGLAARRSLATAWDERTWSVTCFFIAREWRGRGVAARLLEGAVALARARGATRLEGYPALPPRAGGALPAAFAWTGLPALFERAGFEALDETPGKRPIYVRTFRQR
jgi:GNAT superfamily N-acetyltransferase